jgi:hypothetical protein
MYSERLNVIAEERDQALEKASKMATKVELLNEIIQVSVGEQ